jgi:hypothetical protein
MGAFREMNTPQTTPQANSATRADLQRPGSPRLVGRTNRIIIVSWLLLWAAIGVSIRLTLGEWHGFFWGFVVAGLSAAFGTWLLYARPATRRACAASLTWDDSLLIVRDHEGNVVTRIRMDRPHRALLIRAKREARVLLRVEQVDETNRSEERLDLLGPLPMVQPIRPAGDARSLIGFEPGFGKNRVPEDAPFVMCATGSEGDALMTDLLGFLNRHQATRRDTLNLRAARGEVKLDRRGFIVAREGQELRLDIDGNLGLEVLARPFERDAGSGSGVEVFVALVPEGAPAEALVFGMMATSDWISELPGSWSLPEEAVERRVLLYDDTPAAFVARRALLRYALKIAPASPVLELLRS